MHWRVFLDSDVIRYVDLQDKEYTLRIKKVEKGKITGSGGKKSGKAMIWFEGREKPLGAGSTILKTIASLYGNDVRAWTGREITIYPDPGVMFGGEKVGGVRVRPAIPKQTNTKPARTDAPQVSPDEAAEIARLEAEQEGAG